MFFHKRNSVITNQYNQFIRITEAVISAVKESGIQNGIVAVSYTHLTLPTIYSV